MLRRGGGTGVAPGTNPSRRIPVGRSSRAPRRAASPAQNGKKAPQDGAGNAMSRQLHHDAISYATALEMQMAQKATIGPPVQNPYHQPYVPGATMMMPEHSPHHLGACGPAKPYMPIDTTYPGLRCIHAAPPIYHHVGRVTYSL